MLSPLVLNPQLWCTRTPYLCCDLHVEESWLIVHKLPRRHPLSFLSLGKLFTLPRTEHPHLIRTYLCWLLTGFLWGLYLSTWPTCMAFLSPPTDFRNSLLIVYICFQPQMFHAMSYNACSESYLSLLPVFAPPVFSYCHLCTLCALSPAVQTMPTIYH